MDKITELLTQLAAKLGTTTEYLWGVLVKQAPIEATVDIIQIICVLIAGWGIYKLHLYFQKRPEDGNMIYYEYENAAPTIMVIVTVLWAIMICLCIGTISEIVAGFFNPEYWALQKVLHTVH